MASLNRYLYLENTTMHIMMKYVNWFSNIAAELGRIVV